MLFKDIPGLKETKKSLIKAVENDHVAHAQLFAGKTGSANLAMAIAFARFLNCENKQKDDACGECPSCSKLNKLAHPDVSFIFPTSTTSDIKESLSANFLEYWRPFLAEHPYRTVNDWAIHSGTENKQISISVAESRSLIKNISLKAFEGKYKIVIIWMAEKMNASAANSLLKVLEEPPDKTMFFLVTDSTESLLVTILSRCQIVKVRSFNDDEVIDYLKKQVGTEELKAKEIARLAEGNLNKAIQLAGSISGRQSESFKTWMRNCWKFSVLEILNSAAEFQKLNKEAQKGFLESGLALIRETLVTSAGEEQVIKTLPNDVDFVTNFSNVLSTDQLSNISDKLNEAYYHLERNINPQMVFVDTSFDIYKILKQK